MAFQKRLLLVGDGRLAHHIKFYLSLKGIAVLQWSRGSHSLDELISFRDQSQGVLLCISDSALLDVYSKYFETIPVLHFSGAFYDSRMLGAHPLCTFGDTLYPLEFYTRTPWVLDQGRENLQPVWAELLDTLRNPTVQIDPKDKAIYHAFCTMAGNFTQYLWISFFSEMSKLGISKSLTLPFLEKVFENLTDLEFSKPTGPLSRGDFSTIEKHLDILKQTPYSQLYTTFIETYRPEEK